MQNQPRILIVLPEVNVVELKGYISIEASIDADIAVRIIGLNDNLPASVRQAASKENTQLIVENITDSDIEKIIIYGSIPLNLEQLQCDATIRVVHSLATLYRETTSALKLCGLHWLEHAQREWAQSSIGTTRPQEWVEQFARIGNKEIAKKLLKSLRVIDDASLRKAFYTRKEEMLGLRVGHGFFSDEEKGSSSIAVQQVLEHLYPGQVHKLDTKNPATWSSLDLDRLYVYEDGLWSGVELIRRLQSIADSSEFKQSDIHFYFKFAATSDVGLAAARLFTRQLKTSRFHFIPGEVGNHFEFFPKESDTDFLEVPTDVYALRASLDSLVEPYAFKLRDNWSDDRDQSITVCEQVGKQLVKPFLQRKNKEKSTSEEVIVTEEEVKRWQLGAMGFASTVVFSSSIPKPVLPLMWLQGTVNIRDMKIDWQPLFWDVRRTGVYGI